MARAPVLAAGGIVLRREETPLIAVVRLRKRNEWVLPKGKLDDGETPRDAAEREVQEETGHDVSVHEFLGTLVYESGGRFKVVHYWRMETSGGPTHALMDDIRAVDWLPLDAAVERLSRAYERAFLENVGPIALESAAHAQATLAQAALVQAAQRPRVKKQPVPEKRRRPPAVAPQPSPALSASVAPPPDVTPSLIDADEPLVASNMQDASAPTAAEPPSANPATVEAARSPRINLVQKVRDWLRRAA